MTVLKSIFRYVLLLSLALLPTEYTVVRCLAGQEAPATTPHAVAPSPDLSGIAHIALRVHDLGASVSFYERLGFVESFALSKDGKVYEAFIKINDRQFIELYPTTTQHTQPEFLHVCFEGAHLQAVHDFYRAAGLTPTVVKTAGAGNLLFTMPGPATASGPQNMEYTQYMPGSLHAKDIGLHLGPKRIADEIVQATLAVDDPAQARAFYVGKAGFRAGPGNVVQLPGVTRQSLRFVPLTQLGLRSQIVLKVANLHAAERTLKQSGIAYERRDKTLLVLDPDGNQNVLADAE